MTRRCRCGKQLARRSTSGRCRACHGRATIAALVERQRIDWTPEMDDALLVMRAIGFSHRACAERIGVSPDIVSARAAELGLSQRLNRGRVPGPVVMGAIA